ncbi:RusA family crossover junction endodeoxyribonuclease [Metapseudomonas otitidis]|uniref:RusA family crossover junction endodeoxyribonuclease n=1 Tax=Metapseudomonas otitidis TaxID=319939 RepID=UPI00366A7FCB
MIEIELPWPPSVNSYWRHPNKGPLAGRHLISAEGREYRKAVLWQLAPMALSLSGRLAVTVECFPPDRRKRDLDNIAKGLLDAMTHAGAWGDDEQIDDLRIIRRGTIKGGAVRVHIGVIAA